MSKGSVKLTMLFLGRLGPSRRFTITKCSYFRQELTTALLESANGEMEVSGWTKYQTRTSSSRVIRVDDCATRPGYEIVKILNSCMRSFTHPPYMCESVINHLLIYM